MSTRNTLIRSATLVTLLTFASCTEKTTIVQNVIPGEQVTVSGTVLAWKCGVHDALNNYGPEHRFGVQTGDTARVIILYSNGWRDTVLTDSVSGFHRIVPTGLQEIVVETQYTYPDTFQVYLERDTTITLDIVYDILVPDTVELEFDYTPSTDTAGMRREWASICALNGYLGAALSINCSQPRFDWRESFEVGPYRWVVYTVPLRSRQFHTLTVVEQAGAILDDPAITISPEPSVVRPKGMYICMD